MCASVAYAQTDTIRYVHPDGAYANDGRSWANAKNRVQDAINDLREYLKDNGLTSGSVYIAAGTYVPTESTESSGGSMLNTSFKIYEGIHVYGGFNPTTPESKPGDRIMANGKKVSENWADQSGIGTVSGTEISSQWDLRHKTILTGNHSGAVVSFTFDSIRGRYNTTFPASSYHVVWFATNGKYETSDETLKDHFKPLEHPASIDGCVISSGNASSRSTTTREHTAYGGGVYMVGNSSMRACIIERCNATMRGGGIYCDGGGDVEFCCIHTCQSPGVGVVEGYGGGVCIDYEGSIGHSQITSCAARCGGGLLISHVPEEYPTTGVPAIDNISNYSPHTTACVVNNNTANAEGGGIYLAEGGTVNHATVCGNNCSGRDVTYYGRRHGRTGGLYVRNCGQIFNSVIWGNRCDANSDIQFASVRQKTGIASYETFVYHTAFMNHDITDWTGVRKESVYSLDKNNMPTSGGSDNFCCFFRPTVVPLNWDSVNTTEGIYGAGVLAHMRPVDYPGPRIWHLTSHSYLDQKGVQWSSAMVDPPTWLVHAHTEYGVVSNPYEPASTLGALVRKPDNMRHALIAPQGLEGRKDATPIPTIFVDLHHEGEFDEDHFVTPDHSGDSWDAPIHSIGDALMYYRTYLVEEPNKAIGKRAHYHLPTAWDEDNNPTAYDDFDFVQILVKEGEQSTAGPNNYLGKDMRTASIRTLSHMRLYGGYPKTLTGTSTEGRDPLNHPTIITANIADEKGVTAYANNSAHVLTYVNTEYTIVDGFQLLNGNAHNLTGSAVMAGGGVLVSNDQNVITVRSKRIDMVGNELRNCRIANNSAPKGAAIYVTGDSRNMVNGLCYAELKVVNCIIRNNTADYASGNNGVITANGRAFIDIDHCDIVNNVGYPLQSDNKWWRYGNTLEYNGNIRIDNSLIYCNGTEVLNDRSALAANTPLSVDAATQNYVFGTYNMFDADIQLHTADDTQPHGFFKSDFTVDKAGVLPSGMPDAANHPLNLVMPAEKFNQCNLTRADRNAETYPVFVNPSRNIGHSVEGDRPLYGGKVSFIPLNNNPCVNAASVSAYGANNVPRPEAEDFDLTDYTRRNYGGEPDIGALEDADLPISGSVIYVTPEGAGKRDGSSWANAIAGNTVYVLNDIAGPALADGDQIDPELTCDRVLDSEGNPILTTNEKYNGGWGRVWMNTHTIYSTTHDATVHDHITYKSIYYGGAGDGEGREVVDSLRESRETLPDGEGVISIPEGFVPGSYEDPRYPYGEISGASRTFWRANPYTAGSYGNVNTFTNACNTNGWIKNTRAERYVGGLQYAVEKASAANKTYHSDSVQVWVGAGTYNDYKGFVMRDSVTVLGGFPADKYSSPGLTERQALMSNVINIPKSKQAEKLNAVDYETILQISDVNPKRDNTHLETDAVKYWDDDIDFVENSTITGEVEADRVVTRVYTWQTSETTEDVTATYYQNSTFHNNQIQNETTEGDFHSLDFGTATVEKDCWHLTYTGNASTEGSNGVIGRYEADQMSYKGHSNQDIYENGQRVAKTTNDGLAIRNGSLSGVKVWQTMKNVPAGYYRIVVDLNAYYRNANNQVNYNEPTGVNFIVLASDGDTLLKAPIHAKNKVGDRLQNNLARWQLNRYTFDSIIQPADGLLKVSIEIGELDGSKGANREALMANFKLIHVMPGNAYSQTDYSDVRTQHPGSTGSSTSTYSSTASTHRTTLRKRVLTMPDVCVPTYGGGGIGDPVTMGQAFTNDALPHTDRVWGPTKELRTAATLAKQEDSHYVEYNEATWDGFTLRHGFLYDEAMAHGGGAGVNMYEGAHLRNCIVINNVSACQRVKGAGMFCDGATSTIEGCFVLNNTSTRGSASALMDNQIFAGGMFMYEGTCFNSLFANNYSHGSAGGLGFCVGRFFNNTIAYNTATLVETSISGGAISLATSSNPNLFVANTVIFGNNGIAIRDRNAGVDKVNPFLYCYIQSAVAQPNATTKNNVYNWSESATSNYGTGNTFLNGVAPSAANTPFAADFDESGNYVAGRAASRNDFRLRDDVPCVNKGTEEFAGEFYTALRHKGKTDSQIRNSFIYKSVEAAQLPDNDVAFAKRVQDCQIDMGAYEFNAAYSIKPDTTTHPGQAIFYVTFDAQGGDASADSPENAACKQKLQLVLDAAGRYKYNLMTLAKYDKGEAGTYVADQPNKHWNVEVWLEGDNTNSTVSNVYADWYTATRSTKHNKENYVDNTLDYSFIIPHGVHVKGGFTTDFTGRDPLTYRTVLSGKITSSTGAEGNTFHVVTFTNDLFTPDETFFSDTDDKPIRNQLATLTDERHRAVLDGVFIEDGHANSPDYADRIGAGAVVTDYAHIRNCVIQNNTADGYGGGLYLKPKALVSGTIVKYNTANVGGGIYVEAPAISIHMNDSLAYVFYSTICENTGRASAGGLFFDNTYARINSSAIWHNNANDNANVAGNFARAEDNLPYPMNCCAVESRRLEGQGNIELSPMETEGVRWDRMDPFDAILYYPIEMSSTLARAGISYTEWNNFYIKFATLDSIDIAGVSRKRWTSDGSARGYAWGSEPADTLVTKNNDIIDIGARAINKNFEVHVDAQYVMHRLYVVHTELIDSKAARALQDNTNTDEVSNMYRQMGSCIYNPFHRLSDAFEYIIKARKMNPKMYRNTRFEVFVEQGTYYPVRDAYMRQGTVRMNTFLVPEAILIVGGVDSRPADHKYGQEGFKSPFSTVHLIGDSTGGGVDVPIPGTGYTINFEFTDSIRLRDERHRPMRDNNLNSVIEPWELERQTILSGNAVSGEDFTHIYHVVTCHADTNYIGPRPLKFGALNPNYGLPGHETESVLTDTLWDNAPSTWVEENDLSVLARTIGFDGLQITGGYANRVDSLDTVDVFVRKTYFRGGGIYVDGNWREGAYDNPPDMTQPSQHNIPIVVENIYFTNNMAGNGGAIYSNGGIYAYGNRFTQNYSQGPMTKIDQRYIPWTAGGCIATNAFCGVSNCLFDNNEARRGLFPLKAESTDPIPNADARQGFGGCLSIADKSTTRVMNCHFMKNKAVAYSAMYNFFANNRYSVADSMQFAFNTIFWGNEVFEVDHLTDLEHGKVADGWDGEDEALLTASSATFDTNYKASRKGVFHYDGKEWDRYEELFHRYDSTYNYWVAQNDTFNKAVVDTLMKLRAQGNKMEGLYFCSYRKTYGPSGMKPTSDGYLLTRAEQRAWEDPRSKRVNTKTDANDDLVENYDNLWTHVRGNNNTLINPINTATDGPNFKQPTFVAGIDGYMQNADWLQARMNITTDQGWGSLKQNVVRGVSYYITRYTGTQQFDNAEDALKEAKKVNPEATEADVFPVRGLPVASFTGKPNNTDSLPMYNFLAWRYGRMMSASNAPLPLGDQYYMHYTRSGSDSEMSGNMDRISKNPKMGVKDVYIDLGVYEYQYVQLDIEGQEIDTVWVATKAKDPIKHDGLTWETPTTDLQAAIDLLMSSHNNHDKYVCFLGNDEGETFSPQNVIDNRLAFAITSNSTSPLLPDSAMADFDYGVNSLTFLGGYSYDVKNAKRDPLAHPTVIEMPNTGNESQRNQLFVVEDMTRQMLQANFVGEYTSRDSVVIPIVFDGITFINPYSTKEPDPDAYSSLGGQMSKKGGAAIYYRWQRRYVDDGTQTGSPNFNLALHPDSALIDGRKVTLPKLTISNCIFMDNGKRTTNHAERSPAVRIDHGGGSSLIVNTLFHSNAGAPVYSRTFDVLTEPNDLASVPNDVVMVNITSALNDGHIRLESEGSEVHNSLIWMDDLDNDTTVQLQMGASDQWDKTDNKDREGIDGRMSYNAVWGCFQAFDELENDPGDSYHNHPLSSDNSDIFKGPGFLSPYLTASTSEQRRERSFRLNPSLRTHQKASQEIYLDRVFFRVYPDTCAETDNKYWRRSNGFKSLMFTKVVENLANDSDLASKPRLSGPGMERGAYECLAMLQRVLYVNPTIPEESAGDGSNWEKAFGQGQLQNAIDAAAVYAYMYQELPREDRKAYVYVKGSGNMTDHYSITARDGVYVYGSLSGNFTDTAWINAEKKFTNEECRRFKNYVRASRSGIATSNSQTRINSIHITGDAFRTGFLLDGFVITNPNAHLATSPVLIDNEMAVVRNCLIADNHVIDAEHPVADVQHGLLYNCLIYNDSADVLVKVGANGLVLNNTIVADTSIITPLDATAAADGAVQNNIAGQQSELTCFAPYMTTNNPYTLPAYLTNNPSLAYQLHEHSAMINSGTMDRDLPALFTPYREDSVILFKWDRDVLGNPRKISSSVDMGALETWYVAEKDAQEVTALTNKVTHEADAPLVRDTAFTKNYGGNYYPHTGSVVYLMDSAAMTMQYETANDFKDLKDVDISLRPGFLLLKQGASFYGNGHEVQIGYIAAEKRFKDQRYTMTAFPFNYSVENITVTTYDGTTGALHTQLSPFAFNTYQYNGAARSAKDYVFQTDNSDLWTKIDTVNRTATDGYLMDFGATLTDTEIRFNAFAASGTYIYTEGEDNNSDGYPDDKYIYLKQYDNRTAGTGESLNFTSMENMGWNMKGLPWLVTNYRTDTILWEDNFLRQMYIPHVLYQMDGAGDYITEGDNVYTSRSWDRGTVVSMGNAFFTQTATPRDTETVIFHIPYYGRNEKASRPILRLVSHRPNNMLRRQASSNVLFSDIVSFNPDPNIDKTVRYTYGRDGVKWLTSNRSAQVYLLDSKRTDRISLLGAAPTEVDIPLGVSVPDSLDNATFSFDLPEKEAFNGYRYVWLIDYLKNRTINLLESDYEAELPAGMLNTRFAVRIGGFPMTDSKGKREYLVFTFDGMLYVRGLIPGDKITVYATTGQLVTRDVATGNEWSVPLNNQTSYLVMVNDSPHKVVNL